MYLFGVGGACLRHAAPPRTHQTAGAMRRRPPCKRQGRMLLLMAFALAPRAAAAAAAAAPHPCSDGTHSCDASAGRASILPTLVSCKNGTL
eukprot:gene15970-biopygen9757